MAILQEGTQNNYSGVMYHIEGTTTVKCIYGKGENGLLGHREPDIITGEGFENTGTYDVEISNLNIINGILGTSYTTADQLKEVLQSDYNNMIESVKKYKGFYVGRYETSIDVTKKQAYSKVGVIPTAATNNGNSWYGLYAYQKKMAEANGYTSVSSYMIWRK